MAAAVSRRPSRVQRRRTAGWTSPPGSVYVGRPTRWGNPWRVGQTVSAAEAVRRYRAMFEAMDPVTRRALLAPLRGRSLQCWCALEAPCHADVLLELANR